MHSHTKASPRAQDVYPLFPSIRAQQKAQAWGKDLNIRRLAQTRARTEARLVMERVEKMAFLSTVLA